MKFSSRRDALPRRAALRPADPEGGGSGRNVQGRPINSSKGGMHFLPLLSAEDQKEVSREREWGQDDAGGSGSEFDNPTFDISREEDSEQSDV